MSKVCVDVAGHLSAMTKYTWSLIARDLEIDFEFVESKDKADVLISDKHEGHIRISDTWIHRYDQRDFDHKRLFSTSPVIRDSAGNPDFFSTIFYMVNSLQEWTDDRSSFDHLGRFRYEASYQKAHNCIHRNLVWEYIVSLAESLPIPVDIPRRVSSYHLTHDVDLMTSGIKEDFVFLIRTGRIIKAIQLLINRLFGPSHWDNLESIMSLHEKYGKQSTFFLISQKGVCDTLPELENADYDVQKERYQRQLKDMLRRGFQVGLHKSLNTTSYSTELSQLGIETTHNRSHYLRFKLPEHYSTLESVGITDDHSLGFSDIYGFRNSYGRSFQPFNIEKDRPYDLTVHPLHVMDTTFWGHMSMSADEAEKRIHAFLAKHPMNCEFGIVWHNHIFSSYKYGDFAGVYKRLFLESTHGMD